MWHDEHVAFWRQNLSRCMSQRRDTTGHGSFSRTLKKSALRAPRARTCWPSTTTTRIEVVEGKPMKDHFRFAVAYWHTFRGAGRRPVRSRAPCCARGKPPWTHGRQRQEPRARGVRVHGKVGRVSSTAFTIATSPPREATLAESEQEPGRGGEGAQGRAAADRHQLCCGARPTCSAIRATCTAPPPAPMPTPSPLPRRR